MLLTVKNLGGSRLLHTTRGPRVLEPGASITTDFVDAQADAYRDEPDLEVSEATADEAATDLTLAERAEALGITVDKRWGENRIRKEIEKATKR